MPVIAVPDDVPLFNREVVEQLVKEIEPFLYGDEARGNNVQMYVVASIVIGYLINLEAHQSGSGDMMRNIMINTIITAYDQAKKNISALMMPPNTTLN